MEAGPSRPASHVGSSIAVIVLTALVLASQVWAGLANGWPTYRPGWTVEPVGPDRGRVTAIAKKSPAARAGVRVGDVVVFDTPADRRQILIRRRDASPVPVTVIRDGARTSVDVGATEGPSYLAALPLDSALTLLAIAVAAVAVCVAAVIVLKIPGVMSWSLWIGMLGLCWTVPAQFRILPYPTDLLAYTLANAIFTNVALWALPCFALRFPDGRLQPRSHVIDRAFFVALVFVSLLTLTFYALQSFAMWFPLSWRPQFYQWSMLSSVVPVTATLWIVIDRLRGARGEQRARLRWAILGIGISSISYAANIGLLGLGASTLSNIFNEASNVLSIPALALPFAVLYALGREQIVDARVVVNRTVVYGTLTAVLVGGIALIDWGLGRILSGSRLALVLEAAVTVALGATLNVMHVRVERAVEGFVFARRRAAERFLHRLATTLPIAMSEGTIERAMTLEVCEALALASGAVFRRDIANDVFVRTASFGWDDAMLQNLHLEDELVRFLLTERVAIRVPDVRWRRRGLPSGTAAPAYALPIMVRGEVTGMAIFGGHSDRTAIEPEELAILQTFVERSAAALDLVAASLLRNELAAYRSLYGPAKTIAALAP